jgi:dihydroorotate dehydrogenase
MLSSMFLGAAFSLARPFLFGFAPENAHEMTLRALESGLYPRGCASDPRLDVLAFGLKFPNPVGIAAGFDKDARVPDAVLGLGCGFAEVGTITPEPQAGNPQPRVFRLVADGAMINRLGFNNGGHCAALARLEARRGRGGIVGVNVGANKDTADKVADYVRGIDTFYDLASYFMVNISSPNTPGLRDLQAPAALDALLGRVMAARAAHVAKGAPSRPILVKIAPDIAEDDLAPIVARLVANGVDGIAVSNTTLSRAKLRAVADGAEAGGLSGRPLFERSTIVLARVFELTGGKVPLIGIGGIHSGTTAVDKIAAGATLVQLYTGLVYEGPALIGQMTQALAAAVQAMGPGKTMVDLVGRDAKSWAARKIDS